VLGAYVYKDAAIEVGAALQYDFTRRLAADDERFLHLRDIRDTPRFKLFASRTIFFVTGDTSVATDIAGHSQGTLAQANLWFTIPFAPRCLLSIGPGLTWADHDYMATFYGITEVQAARAPLAVYSARAGIVDRHLNGIATYDISSRWSLGASASVTHFGRDALHSPVTQQSSQTTMVAWLTYKL
jgi:outer membrane scaffolding protein for murein synthesis (MipA/OmpV family)